MDDFIKIIKKDPQIRIKIKDMLDRNIRLPYNYQSKIGYDTLIRNVYLEELINLMGTTITNLDIEKKTKISRIKYLEDILMYNKWWIFTWCNINISLDI